MKKCLAILLVFCLLLSSCGVHIESKTDNQPTESQSPVAETNIQSGLNYNGLDDPKLLRYVEDNIYAVLLNHLSEEGLFVENVEAVYYSNEYLEELAFNSQSSIYFGYTLGELDACFEGTRYAFTLSNTGETTVIPLVEYDDDTTETILKNVAIGTGVILVCVTVSAVTAGVGAPAISMIFAASAKTGALFAMSSGAIGGISSALITGYQTGDFNAALKSGAIGASEGFKWGAITGAVSGGGKEFFALKGATLNGLSMNDAALIQKESGYPVEVIKQFHSMDEYNVFKEAGLKSEMINQKLALVRKDIDLYNIIDEQNRNNLTRMQQGLAPLDATKKPFELHHIGQRNDATLAILTEAEHNSPALHRFIQSSQIDRPGFQKVRQEFWKAMAKNLLEGVI